MAEEFQQHAANGAAGGVSGHATVEHGGGYMFRQVEREISPATGEDGLSLMLQPDQFDFDFCVCDKRTNTSLHLKQQKHQ